MITQLLLLGLAHAQGISADVELLRPSWSLGALPGIDSPWIEEAGTLRGGGFTQYSRDPLVLYENEEETGAVISHRATLTLGASWDIGRVASARLSLPSAIQWGTDVPEFSREGPVLGDATAGLRLRVAPPRDVFTPALRADLVLPTSTSQAWMGEDLPRGILGGLFASKLGPFDLLADIGLIVRPTIPTGSAFALGSELAPNLGVRYHLWPERVALHVSTLNRLGLERLLRGGAENSAELVTGMQLQPTREVQWDIAVGKGLSDGYGTSEFRLVAAATYIRRPPAPETAPPIRIVEVPDTGPQDVILPPPEEEEDYIWQEEELARVEGERIVIRDPIQFEFNTERILPESIPTLVYVGGLLNDNWQILHLLIEGHASEEGSHAYNYDLSIRRARAIWEELIRAEVHPDRMSYRGMGETVPRAKGEDEVSLATNRRVEFKIIHQLSGDERPETYRPEVRLPWSGDDATITNPEAPPPSDPKPVRPPPDPDAPLDVDQFLEEQDGELDSDVDEALQDDGGSDSPSEPATVPDQESR